MATFTSVSVKEFMIDNGFNQVVNSVNTNVNAYPFVTFITGANVATNIYFSKGASEEVSKGQSIGKGFFDGFVVVTTTNAAGEERIKIGRKGEGNRVDLSDLF